jgi:hypothetical protein
MLKLDKSHVHQGVINLLEVNGGVITGQVVLTNQCYLCLKQESSIKAFEHDYTYIGQILARN